MIFHIMTLAVLAAATPSDPFHLISSTPGKTEVRLLAPEPAWESVTIRGRSYQAVRLEGAVSEGTPGQPDLPVYHFAVAIPPGTQPSVAVVASDRASYRDIMVAPTARSAVLPRGRGRGSEVISIPMDPARVADPYPTIRARVVRTGRMRSMDIAYLEVSPFQYYPSQRLLCLDRDVTVIVTTSPGGPAIARRPLTQDFMEPVLSRLVLNWDQARSWRQGTPSVMPREIRHWDPPYPAFKLLVDRPAYYSVTGADLQAAGMPIASIDPSTLRLLAQGEETPLHVVGGQDGRLDPQDRVEFLGEPVYREDQGHRLVPIGGVFTETNVYWLTWGGDAGLRMETRTVQAQGSGVRPSYFREQAHAERDLNPFVPDEAATSGDRYGTEWFWGPPQIPSDGWVYYALTLRGRADVPTGVQLRVSLRGYTHPDFHLNPHHHAVVYLNNVQLTHLLWYANDEAFYDSRFDPQYDPAMWPNNGALYEGENNFAVELPGDTQYEDFDGVYTDWFEVDYWRAYQAWNDSLAFWSPQQQGPDTYLYTVTGFSDSGQILVDLTHGQILQGYQEVDLGAVGNWAVKFRDSTVDSTHYLALAATRKASVLGIVDEVSSDLHDASGADFVVISHPELIEQAARLTVGRTFGDTPVSAMVVDAHDVYDEYSYGVFDPRAIRDFLEDAYVHWATPPSFVLLFGDASWDYKLNSPTSDPTHRNFVPSFSNPAIDDYFANVDDAGGTDSLIPDLYLARIPVENADTARIVVDKLLGYEAGDWDPGPWREHVLLIAGGYLDSEGNDTRPYFNASCCTLINRWVLPEPAHYDTLFFTRPVNTHFNNEFETTEDETLQHYFNDIGTAHATYIGHGASWTWETMFWASDVENDLTNTRMLPMVNSMTCHTGRFANPEIDSFGEIWLWQPHGAMGFWGTTGWGNTGLDNVMIGTQFEVIFQQQERYPIVANLLSKLTPDLARYLDEPMVSPLFFTWLGDPLLRLALAERPDWVIGAMWVEPQPIVSGDTVRVHITVRNDGIDPGPATILRLFDADPDSGGTVLTELDAPAIDDGESTTVVWTTVATGSAGERFVYAWANPDTAQQEGYRGNNRADTSYVVIDPIPDLATADSMLHFTPPLPQVLDSVVTFSVEIRNIGTGPAGPFRVLFTDFFTTGGTLRELADVPVDGLARGGSTTVEAVWYLSDNDAGDHVVHVAVDSLDVIEELNESNNTATAAVHVASRAELVAQLIRPSNARPPEGDSLSLTGVWQNAGESATPAYEVAIYHGHPDSAGSYVVGVESRESTPGGATDSLVVTWDTIGQVGFHTFYFVADHLGTVPELDETNNMRWTTLEVVSGPDLSVSGFSLLPEAPVEGDSATVSFVVRNGGMIPADSFTVLLNLDGETIREWRFDASGRSSEVLTHSWAWERGASAGDHVVEVVLDALDEVAETNEDNNTYERTLHVMALADLVVTLTPSDTALVDGDALTLKSMIRNLGEASAHTVRLTWYQTDDAWSAVDSVVVPTVDGGESRAESTSIVVHTGQRAFLARVSTPVEEQRLDNNEASCSVSVRALTPPDLVMRPVVLSEDTVTAGEAVRAHVIVDNAGEAVADSAWIELRILPRDSLVSSVRLAPPAPGASSSAQVEWTPPHDESLWRLTASCIPVDGVPGNESDTVRVVAVWPAELEATRGLLAEPPCPLAGDTVSVTVVVRNSGERPAPLYTVALFRGNPAPGQPEVAELLETVTPPQGLNPGDSASVVLHWATPDDTGPVDLYAWIDAAQVVPERNEANNLLSTTIEILAREFAIDPVIPLPSPAPGRTSFVIHASHDASVKVTIYTVSGRLVQMLGPVSVAAARREAIPWACDDRDGDRVANGVYLYRAEATSARTAERASYEGKVIVRR